MDKSFIMNYLCNILSLICNILLQIGLTKVRADNLHNYKSKKWP